MCITNYSSSVCDSDITVYKVLVKKGHKYFPPFYLPDTTIYKFKLSDYSSYSQKYKHLPCYGFHVFPYMSLAKLYAEYLQNHFFFQKSKIYKFTIPKNTPINTGIIRIRSNDYATNFSHISLACITSPILINPKPSIVIHT